MFENALYCFSDTEVTGVSEEMREWLLYAAIGLFVVVVVTTAWITIPELAAPALNCTAPPATAVDTQTTVSDAVTLRVSINTATVQELMLVDGIGEKTAQKIVDYRETHGGFDSLEELLNISGIGAKKLEAWRPYLVL